jgi:hypothetical protein
VLHRDYVRSFGKNVHFNDPKYDQRELEADRYVAEVLTQPSRLTGAFWTMIGEFIEHEYRKTYEGLNSRGKTEEVNPYSEFFPIRYAMEVEYSQYNMPLLLRAIRIIDVLTSQSPGLDETGYYQQMRKNVRAVRSKSDLDIVGPWIVWVIVGILALLGIAMITYQFRRKRT